MALLSPRETRERIRQLGLETRTTADFALREKSAYLAYNWHSHSRHQLLYSLSGRVVLETAQTRWFLPPQRAAWIPPRCRHKTTIDHAETISVYFRTVAQDLRWPTIRVLPAGPLLREMLIHASRWPAPQPGARPRDPMRRAFFGTLALLCREWVREELPFRLPVANDPQIEKAAGYLRAHLDSCRMDDAARFTGQSVRTLRRRFAPAMGLNWRTYRMQAALLQAMDALLNSGESITQIALAVGYDNPSAFSKAFARFAGANPLAFRQANLRSFHGR